MQRREQGLEDAASPRRGIHVVLGLRVPVRAAPRKGGQEAGRRIAASCGSFLRALGQDMSCGCGREARRSLIIAVSPVGRGGVAAAVRCSRSLVPPDGGDGQNVSEAQRCSVLVATGREEEKARG